MWRDYIEESILCMNKKVKNSNFGGSFVTFVSYILFFTFIFKVLVQLVWTFHSLVLSMYMESLNMQIV